jgi:FkbM family methyltransferase
LAARNDERGGVIWTKRDRSRHEAFEEKDVQVAASPSSPIPRVDRLGEGLHWAAKTLRRTLERSRNYVVLTPPAAKTQWVWAKRERRLHRYTTRSRIDHSVLQQIFDAEDYKLTDGRGLEIGALYRRCVDAGRVPLILDCGANIGISADYFAQHYPAARIVAIEPDRDNIELARRNCATPQVEFLHAGIAAEDGRGAVVDLGLGAWAIRTERAEDGPIAMLSVATILERYPDAVPLLIKIDIEGFEQELFSKNTEWVARFPLVIIELHDWMLPRSASSGPFLRTIAALDRDFVYRGENVFSFANDAVELAPDHRRAARSAASAAGSASGSEQTGPSQT